MNYACKRKLKLTDRELRLNDLNKLRYLKVGGYPINNPHSLKHRRLRNLKEKEGHSSITNPTRIRHISDAGPVLDQSHTHSRLRTYIGHTDTHYTKRQTGCCG